MKQSNILLGIAILAVIIALANAIVVFQKVDNLETLSGHVTSDGTAKLQVLDNLAINFTNDEINWGAGMHYNDTTEATLNSEGDVIGGNWTTVSSGLILENTGNVNASIDLAAGGTAATFIGGTSPSYKWKVIESEGGSCSGTIGDTTYVSVTTGTIMCSQMRYIVGSDELEFDIEVVIPEDTPKESKSDTITATATSA
jgi:hypothetical protein